MRNKLTENGLTVNAIAGTYVVLLGFNLAEAQRPGCLGFAIQREDRTEHELYWLSGTKTFKETDPGLGPGGQVSSRDHPFQTFQWADYSAKPEHNYTFTVIPLYGTPEKIKEGDGVSLSISTEKEFGDRHSVFFNRGAVASQEYARRFQNQPPSQVGDPAYRWLSRGLLEALVAFVSRANGAGYGLYGAIYEFQWPAALNAIKAAADTGAKVTILYDGIQGGSGPADHNVQAIQAAGIGDLCIPRTTGKIMHNKFFVLTKEDQPVAVWTGSTNLTENGIYGQSNLGHAVEDAGVAEAYLAYWNELKGNPDAKTEKAWMATHNPAPPDPWDSDTELVFSPHSGLAVLDWYGHIAGSAQKALFMTFAFGMNKQLMDVYEHNDGILRFALMEKAGSGRGLAQARIDIGRIRMLPNVIVAIGNNITTNSFDRWLAERSGVVTQENVRWVHTKYMLVDPLGNHPIIVTGSANFSDASTDTNNENMLIIRNDQRVADIYLGEFMRLYSHYAFREAVAISRSENKDKTWQPNYLISDDSWQASYFAQGSGRSLRRLYFAGQ
jgi:phosphatidylserine/phosphatidylglycerophosphate/cardiolipin synthase-like enzyme